MVWATLLVAALTLGGAGSLLAETRPITFELAASPPVTSGDQFILDPYLLEVQIEDPATTTSKSDVVPTETLVALCGDGDGCILRMMLFDQLGIQRATLRLFFTNGNKWTLFEYPTSDGATESGSLSQSPNVTILLLADVDFDCSFVEKTPSFLGTFFHLEASVPGFPALGEVHCVLRIED